MRISDWSSDVCSSDLHRRRRLRRPPLRPRVRRGHRPGRGAVPAREDRGGVGALLRLMQLPVKIAAQVEKVAPPSGSESRGGIARWHSQRSEEHTSELQSLMRISYAVFCLKKKK